MGPFAQGILLGLTFAVLLGPAFFALIQTSIHRGFRYGAFLAIGIFLSDLFALLLCYFGASQILGADPRQNVYFSVIGGIILVIFGTYTGTRKGIRPSEEKAGPIETPSKFYVYIIKGFLLNGLNPGMWFLWITIVVSISANYGVNSHSIFLFLTGALITIFLTDIFKCYVSNQLKQFVNAKVTTWMNRIVGIILIGIGTYLVIRVFVDMERLLILSKELFKEG
ncbi:MAG: LysE family transporter [Bacteroidales bacterium]|nr:LysE family transporter [Bacteroidales bacterium]MCF8403550.1 LysE family transporter [Bacteroidales bacterium]